MEGRVSGDGSSGEGGVGEDECEGENEVGRVSDGCGIIRVSDGCGIIHLQFFPLGKVIPSTIS